MKVVEIVVDPKGATTVATRRFSGPSCREAGRPYEEALGARLAERPTAEMYVAPEARPDLRQPT